MIQKLRRKFIAANMLLVSIVLFAVFAVQVFSARHQAQLEVYHASLQALEWAEHASAPGFEFVPPGGGRVPDAVRPAGSRDPFSHVVPAFAVEVDENRAVFSIQAAPGVTVTAESAQALVDAALAQSGGHGELPGQSLSYLYRLGEDGRQFFAFADNSSVGGAVRSQLLTSLLISAAALLAFYFISRFMAARSVRPVERAWAQQRQFVADASHELKTPLTAALSNVDLVLESPDAEKDRRRLDITRIELGRMRELVEKLLTLARADAGQVTEAELSPVDLSRLLDLCVSSFEPVFFEAGKYLDNEIAPECTVRGDSEKLRELVDILLDNACKYSAAGSVTTTRLTREDRGRLHLQVESDGAPIPPGELERVFERFYRADRSRGEVPGYGLGLSIARETAVRHKGALWAESDETGHTVFHLLLPAAQSGGGR